MISKLLWLDKYLNTWDAYSKFCTIYYHAWWLKYANVLPDQSEHSSGPSSPVSSKGAFGLATIVRRAASVASVAAKQAYAAASNNADDEMLPLNCSLMSVSLPWEHIAHDLLLKVTV